MTRRRAIRSLAAGAVGTSTALAGCVTTDLSVTADGVEGSDVFESFSLSDSISWGSNRAWVGASLTDAATTDLQVRSLTVVTPSGSAYWTGTVSGGATSATMSVPVGTRVTVSAFDSDDALVDSLPLRVGGNTFP